MIQPGTFHTLKIGRPTDGGILLLDAAQGAVLLPEHEYETEPVSGRYQQVFVYQNNDGALRATLKKPLVQLGEAALLTAKSVTDVGAFMDWGLDKDIFVPFKEQTVRIEEGEKYVIVLYWDSKSDRLAGSARLGRYLNNVGVDYEEGQQVSLLFGDKSDMGYNVVIDRKYLGLVYHNEVFQNVHYGDTTTGYIKTIRQNNKIDVSLQKSGIESIFDGADVVLTALEKNRGFLPLNDDSSPEEIKNRLGISKKLFKKSLSKLYRQRVITLHEDGIRLTDLE
jgi:uncharacterized protein